MAYGWEGNRGPGGKHRQPTAWFISNNHLPVPGSASATDARSMSMSLYLTVPTATATVENRRFRWFGHVQDMEDPRQAKQARPHRILGEKKKPTSTTSHLPMTPTGQT